MKTLFKTVTAGLGVVAAAGSLAGAEAPPAVFGNYLKPDTMTKGEVVVVIPPREIGDYVAKVEEAAKEDPEWFREFSKNAKPGVPLPFHEKLGLTKDDYAAYLKLWDQREMKVVPNGNVMVRLEQPEDGQWMIRVTGLGAPLQLLRYIEDGDKVQSPNGTLERIEDIDADPQSILGAWTGHEWKYQEESSLGKTKENFAIGKTGDGKWGILVYRLQEVSSTGRRLYDKSLVVRFALVAN